MISLSIRVSSIDLFERNCDSPSVGGALGEPPAFPGLSAFDHQGDRFTAA
jgi:hypothetical protein